MWNSIITAAPPGADTEPDLPRMNLVLAPLLLILTAAAGRAELVLPLPATASMTAESVQSPGGAPVARAAFAGEGDGLILTEGVVTLQAWRVPASTETTLALLQPLRAAVADAGYATLLECETDACGGFDFRYAIPVLPEPEMHVDLGDFRYLSAERTGPEGASYLALLVSRSNESGFIQLLSVTPPPRGPAPDAAALSSAATAGTADAADGAVPRLPSDVAAALDSAGVAVLDDLVFASGAPDLAPGDYPSLGALARWLSAHPGRQVTLVGHTDAQGSLAANIALSKRRAQSVADRLVSDFGIERARVSAEGAGYLAPRASNDTEEGRHKNRRVEVMLTPTR